MYLLSCKFVVTFCNIHFPLRIRIIGWVSPNNPFSETKQVLRFSPYGYWLQQNKWYRKCHSCFMEYEPCTSEPSSYCTSPIVCTAWQAAPKDCTAVSHTLHLYWLFAFADVICWHDNSNCQTMQFRLWDFSSAKLVQAASCKGTVPL